MWLSFKQLVRSAVGHWLQSVGGAFLAVIGLVADIQEWILPGWLWFLASLFLILWALLKTFHEIRIEREAAVEDLYTHLDYQGIANMLTTQYEFGVHELKGYAPRDTDRDEATKHRYSIWANDVSTWNEDVKQMMERLGCSQQEISRFWTIDQLRPGMMLVGDVYERSIWLHDTRLERLWELVESYKARAEKLKRY